ncbi:MAG TPA: class I SAM-dependent methyltransferase [Gammaproteobacteria bacterium]
MSEADRRKWNERYREGAYAEREHPTALLEEWSARLPRGRALDVACGAGRNSLFLASTGRQVDAVDISGVALDRARQAAADRGLDVRFIEADLESAALPAGPYDLIVLVRYVNRALFPQLIERFAAGGVLLCEQHVDADEDVAGPRSAAFRMRRNELLRAALSAPPGQAIVELYREGIVTDPDGRRVALAQLILRGKAR